MAFTICLPAKVYFFISLFTILVIAYQNYNNVDVYCLGDFSCKATTLFIFLLKIIYILFWTWLLNLICSSGYSYVSWLLVLLPYLLLFVLLLLFMISS